MYTFMSAEHALIIGTHRGGLKPSHIARNVGMPHSTISRILTKWKICGCMTTQSAGHRLCKLSDQVFQNLAHDINQDRCQTLAILGANYQVHWNTVRNYIWELNFGNGIALKNPYLCLMPKANMLAFTRKYKHGQNMIGTRSFGHMNRRLNLERTLDIFE